MINYQNHIEMKKKAVLDIPDMEYLGRSSCRNFESGLSNILEEKLYAYLLNFSTPFQCKLLMVKEMKY